jgi:hypothetical protein
VIRYVLAVFLAVALIGLSVPVIDDAARDVTEHELQRDIADIESAATALRDEEALSPEGHPNARRVVEVTLPAASLTTVGVSQFVIDPVPDQQASIVRYTLADGTTNRERIDARIVYRDPTATRQTTIGGTETLHLVVRADDDGTPVVVVDPPPAERSFHAAITDWQRPALQTRG